MIVDNRVKTIDEAKEIIAELENQKGVKLGGPRGSLRYVGETIDANQVFFEHMEKALGETVGLASEGGYDEISSRAAALMEELEERYADNN